MADDRFSPLPPASGLPFDDIRALVRMIPGVDEEARATAQARADALREPGRDDGLLATLPVFVAGWQGKPKPTFQRPLVAVFASAHGIAAASSALAVDARLQLERLAAGAGALNQVCATYDIGLKVFDLALDLPTPDARLGEAMAEDACAATMAFGMEAVAGGTDLLCLGAIGRGGEVAAAAILHALFGGEASDWISGEASQAAVVAAVAQHRREPVDPLDLMRRLGGRDIAAIAGAILAARLQRIPVVLDGIVVTAAAAVLQVLDASALEHCLAGHAGPHPGHRRALDLLGLPPLLTLGIGAQDGTGAAMAAGLIKAAVARHNEGVPLD